MRKRQLPLCSIRHLTIARQFFYNASEPGKETHVGLRPREYFADGISEDIITGLSKLRWLFVIARNSSFAYKGKAVDVKRVSRELGVRYVLEGSVRKGGNRVRITAQLIDAATGNHIWGRSL